ncbi:pilus assembly PilX N-terminal domain-containing protein [Desulfobacterota bacterium AH_259_B03_O07]|nr:pilus assembly PilX N-terminal domain-containing protein [Desulfobacterota bacterium AH_259_B03_O07]
MNMTALRVAHRDSGQRGIALILALVMLIIMSTIGLTVSFMGHIDFQTMSNYKQGQEAFLSAERCVTEARKRFETIGIETLFFQLQGGTPPDGIELPLNPAINEPYCRSGPRNFNRASESAPVAFIEIPPPTKQMGRPLKNVSLPSGGVGGASAVPVSFLVTGKNAKDKDKKDTNQDINTGVEIAVGFETIVPGGASNLYSGN